MDLIKLNKILEKFWWGVAIVTFLAVCYFSFTDGFDKWMIYFVAPTLAVVMALMRRFMVKKLDRSQQPKNKRK